MNRRPNEINIANPHAEDVERILQNEVPATDFDYRVNPAPYHA
jgi:hypothetical protein